MAMTRSGRARLNQICWTVSLMVVSVPFVFPFLWMVASGFKSASEIFGSATLIPQSPRLQNFVDIFTYQPFARQYFNSLYIALSVTGDTLVIA